MTSQLASHSPRVIIRLDFGSWSVRLADVLQNTAVLYEPLNLRITSRATLVIDVDGIVTLSEVLVDAGSFESREIIHFEYLRDSAVPESEAA